MDPRITIVWEDCGAFPFSYVPSDLRRFEETEAFVREIEVLRGEEERFGCGDKGPSLLGLALLPSSAGAVRHGLSFAALYPPQGRGKTGAVAVCGRILAQKRYPCIPYAPRHGGIRRDILITGLLEDALFEENIWFPAALFAEMLWDPRSPAEELLVRVAMRPDVEKA